MKTPGAGRGTPAAMSDPVCARCGAAKPADGPCAACAFEVGDAPAVAHAAGDAPASALARWWESGRLSVLLAGLCLLGALGLPLLGGLSMRVDGAFVSDLTVRPWDLLMGTYPALRGRLSAWLLPGAAIFLLSLLRSRRTAPSMMATRPLIATVSLAPVVALVLPIVRLRDRGGSPVVGAALALGALGVVLCWHAAAVFGRGMPERIVTPVDPDDDD
jgi:hypothetical protein